MTQRLSAARLGRMHTVLGGYIGRGEMPGLAALVSCGQAVHIEALGALSFGGTPMKRDSIFRIDARRIVGQLFPVILIARLVAMELEYQRTRKQLSFLSNTTQSRPEAKKFTKSINSQRDAAGQFEWTARWMTQSAANCSPSTRQPVDTHAAVDNPVVDGADSFVACCKTMF